MSKFNIILITVFVIAAVLAVLLFSGLIPGFGLGGGAQKADIVFWGTIDKKAMQPIIAVLNEQNKNIFSIQYIEKPASSFENDLINALASSSGPDLWLLPQDLILKHEDKIFITPYSSTLTERDFKDAFVSEAELFINSTGIIGFPFTIDPIVMYWNKDLYQGAGISIPPEFWDEFLVNAPIFSRYDDAGNITQSGAALGEFSNIKNAKELVSMLILQTGNSIVDPQSREIIFNEKGNSILPPAESAVKFYNQFSDPAKDSYVWNRGMEDSRRLFSSGRLANYFGFASDFVVIKNLNPHLNFDAALVPQIKDGSLVATFGRMEAVVVSKASKNISAAFSAAYLLSSAPSIRLVEENLLLPPVRRDIIKEGAKSPEMAVFYKASLQSKGWLEPDTKATYDIFKEMIESSAVGKMRIYEAVRQAEGRLEKLLK
ncbi:MAG: extracellular solute-binding protein [Parcubacteria group bacterium]|nr:extracellular solute-binding protein [Parcubacteria group bacterium]MCR4343066.1 extracellular solute-binding protein [Patescibacteria group bacterium]